VNKTISHYLKIILIGICCLALQSAKAQGQSEQQFQTIIINSMVDSRPEFSGGEDEFFRLVEENFRVNNQIERDCGNKTHILIAEFIVDKFGMLTDISFGGSGIVSAENEMKRVLESLPGWKPAVKDREACSCRVYIPFRFIINNQQFVLTNSGTEMVVGHSKKNKLLKVTIVIACLVGFYFLWVK